MKALMKDSSTQFSDLFADEPQGLVINPNDGEERVRRWGNPFLIKVDELNGGAKQFAAGSEKLFPGKSIHVHRHEDFEEILIITAGKGRATLGDKNFAIESGSLIFIPPRVWHGFDNIGSEDLDLLWIFPKLGMEKFFRATSRPAGLLSAPLTEKELNDIRKHYHGIVEYRDDVLSGYITI